MYSSTAILNQSAAGPALNRNNGVKMHTGRLTLALYNSYDPKNFREAHRRALARAGPLALAFDYNLAVFGFPFPADLHTPIEIADWVATTTSIGEHGGFLKELTAKGRFQTFPYPDKGFSSSIRGDRTYYQKTRRKKEDQCRRSGKPSQKWSKRYVGFRFRT